ncbi:hypothetical protein PK28_09785 [Hymenobacter sp. DG25B]|uniref:hypothetical protein n=1 Tax=Hymenobacter sp. DG25B TaxID=1385664 RepID=UPI0005408AAC|nr:hypothetical protein [Hymenobacter sp. DG25B]AIZ63903.1 hypothetical protein PK28_09785 [Hymenobacter sp. DG25B]
MKSLLSFLVLIWSATGQVSAQSSDRLAELPTPANNRMLHLRAIILTRDMSRTLQLNDTQYERLRVINQTRLARQDEILWLYQDDPAQQRARLSELDLYYEQQCRRILTPAQLDQFIQVQQPAEPETDPHENGLG